MRVEGGRARVAQDAGGPRNRGRDPVVPNSAGPGMRSGCLVAGVREQRGGRGRLSGTSPPWSLPAGPAGPGAAPRPGISSTAGQPSCARGNGGQPAPPATRGISCQVPVARVPARRPHSPETWRPATAAAERARGSQLWARRGLGDGGRRAGTRNGQGQGGQGRAGRTGAGGAGRAEVQPRPRRGSPFPRGRRRGPQGRRRPRYVNPSALPLPSIPATAGQRSGACTNPFSGGGTRSPGGARSRPRSFGRSVRVG